MSYARFSSDNWKSDVYAYVDADGGYTVQVAANRTVDPIPEIPEMPLHGTSYDMASWCNLLDAQLAAVTQGRRVPIGGMYDGQVLRLATEALMFDTLRDLREAGYHVPDSAFEGEDQQDADDDDGPIEAGEPADGVRLFPGSLYWDGCEWRIEADGPTGRDADQQDPVGDWPIDNVDDLPLPLDTDESYPIGFSVTETGVRVYASTIGGAQ